MGNCETSNTQHRTLNIPFGEAWSKVHAVGLADTRTLRRQQTGWAIGNDFVTVNTRLDLSFAMNRLRCVVEAP